MGSALHSSQVRFPVEPRDVPPVKAARRLHLTLAEFEAVLPRLLQRGFPRPDQDTGFYDLKAVDQWMDNRSALTPSNRPRDARDVTTERLAMLAGGRR
ncbi:MULTISPECIES: hypothetical protein [unclassified Bosea (in: a-proteobacteria)]|uniref:hypothetical protein n=1 Tax=unclassified Bosea (in: a-proteobacteria) TaxID=2653178 RepID=UPI000F760C1A|nr:MULTISPECIES: hypothetical protein [unclassified Bosea (in: a-proteobacteria)]AZO77524.1 hypothetical protein BLM15_07765 [Bosea sp. Tri-49]RXT18132.1 hypothetical protein B5U98_22930 [Bosea sp. Tri-39]RXT32729.1 hypothetical protein B5U99_29275 [Bosea sp. Tri-54]